MIMRLYLCEMQPAVAWYFFGLNENVSIVSFATCVAPFESSVFGGTILFLVVLGRVW